MNQPNARVIPVDHRNLRAFYSRGMLTPASLVRRYKPDALAFSPERLPVFPAAMGPALATGEGDDAGITVLLEVSEGALSAAETDPETGTAVFQGLLPLTEVVAAHVRTEEHRAEIASRDYRNIDPAWIPLRVTPALFEGDRPDLEPNLAWLRALPAARALDVGQLETRESLAGALMVLLDGLPAREPLLTQAAALASRQLSWAGAEATNEAFITAIQDVGWVTESHDLADLQAVLVTVLAQGGPEEPAPTEILAALTAALQGQPQGDTASSIRLLEYIGAVIRGETEFRGFRDTHEHRVLKALLLFLLRPAANETKTWLSENAELGDEIRALALVLAGLSCRYAGTPAPQRGSRELQGAVQGWMAGIPQPVAQAKVGNDVRIERQGHALAQWTLETPALRTRLLGSCEPDDPDAVRIALALDWDDCLETIIEAETVELTAARGKAVLRVAGRPRITHVVHVDRFQGRVTELTDVEVDSIPDSASARSPAKRTRKRTTK